MRFGEYRINESHFDENPIYFELFCCESNKTENLLNYYMATRTVYNTSNYAAYRLTAIVEGVLYFAGYYSGNNVTYHGGYINGYHFTLRPVVEIDLTKVNVGVTGTGADGDGYSLTLK